MRCMMRTKMYLVKLDGKDTYSMHGFVMWTTRGCARAYSLEQAEKLIKEIPAHVGKGVLVEVA